MSDTSESLTPSQENLANMNDVRTYEAIDNLMQKDEQTHEEFLNGFTYLKKDDVIKQKKQINKVINPSQNSRIKVTESNDKFSDQSKTVSQNNSPVADNQEEFDLEEEVLEPGTTTNMLSKSSDVRVNASVKFDNFVDTEDDILTDEDEVTDGGYISSFGDTNADKSPKMTTATSDGVVLTKEESLEKIDDLTTEKRDEELPSDLLNPGEVEETDDIPNIGELQIERCLDFSTKVKNDSTETRHNNATSEETEICTDDVEPFSLDENFDYDNVILTPKYSVQEMDFLKSVMQQNEVT